MLQQFKDKPNDYDRECQHFETPAGDLAFLSLEVLVPAGSLTFAANPSTRREHTYGDYANVAESMISSCGRTSYRDFEDLQS